MSLKIYQLNFGGDVDPSTISGLSPTFTQFRNMATGATVSPPGITELYTGAYFFQYDVPLGTQISFLCDGGAALSSGRYLRSDLSALQGIDSVMGATSSSIGTTGVDPTTAMGVLIRLQELLEGTQAFNKTSGIFSMNTRGGTLLRQRTLTNSSAEVDKT